MTLDESPVADEGPAHQRPDACCVSGLLALALVAFLIHGLHMEAVADPYVVQEIRRMWIYAAVTS